MKLTLLESEMSGSHWREGAPEAILEAAPIGTARGVQGLVPAAAPVQALAGG